MSRFQSTAAPPDRVLGRKPPGPQTAGPVPDIVYDVLRSPGEPLGEAARAAMEPRFDYDFSRVRIHTDEGAGDAADAVGANAFAVGPHLVARGAAALAVGSPLLAHELAHVVQNGARDVPASGLAVAAPMSDAEQDARAAGSGAGPAAVGAVGGPTLLFRDPQPAAKRIEVDLDGKTATAKEGDKVVRTMRISSGREKHPTPTGNFTIQPAQSGDKNHKSSKYGHCVSKDGKKRQTGGGADSCGKGEKYAGAPMNNYKRITSEAGFHEGSTGVLSHGCIHLESGDAAWMWDWADTGTPVHITGSGAGGDGKKKPTKPKKKPAGGKKKSASVDGPAADMLADLLPDDDGGEGTLVMEADVDLDESDGEDWFEVWWDEGEEAYA